MGISLSREEVWNVEITQTFQLQEEQLTVPEIESKRVYCMLITRQKCVVKVNNPMVHRKDDGTF